MASSQVIVELDPAQAREVLTETRDSFKAPFDRALSGFRSELELDVKSALEEKEKRKHTVIRGGRGSMKAKLDVSGLSYAPKATAVTPGAPADVHVPLPKAALAVPEEVEFRGARPQPGEVLAEGVLDIAALPKAVLEHFVDAVTRGEPTFLSQWPARDEADEFARRARGGGEAFFAAVSPEFSAFVAANVADRMADAGIPLKQAAADLKYADLHDIHIYAEDIGDDERLKTAMRRWSPDFWAMQGDTRKVDIGRGMSSHRFLSAWTVSCEYALKALQGYAPALFAGKEIPWATGFYFARPEMRWTPVGYEKTRRAALHKEIDGVNVLLVNPLLESGKPAFDITRPKADARYSADGSEAVMGLQELEAMALHEACHVFRAFHDEEFSGLLTGALGLFDRAAARARMREADAAVQAAYGRGRTLVQAMDGAEAAALDPDGKAPAKARGDRKAEAPRPAGKLLAHAARTAAMAAGIALSPENAAFEAPAVREAFLGAVSTAGDGVVTVDCDRLQGLEAALSVGAANGWDEQISLAAFDGMGAQQDEETEAAAPLPATAGPSGSSAARGTAWRPEDTAGLDGLDEALAALRSAPQRSPAGRAAAPVSPGPLVVEGLDDALAALRSEQAALQPPHVAQRPAPLTAPPPPIADGDLPPVDRDEGLAAIADDLVGNEWGMDIFGEETSVQAPGM